MPGLMDTLLFDTTVPYSRASLGVLCVLCVNWGGAGEELCGVGGVMLLCFLIMIIFSGLEITFSLVLSNCQYNARFVLSNLKFVLPIPQYPYKFY